MGDLVPYEKLLIKMIHRNGKEEVKKLYKYTAGFQDPDPPDEEQRKLFEEEHFEL